MLMGIEGLEAPSPQPLSVFWGTLESPRVSMESSLGTTREV